MLINIPAPWSMMGIFFSSISYNHILTMIYHILIVSIYDVPTLIVVTILTIVPILMVPIWDIDTTPIISQNTLMIFHEILIICHNLPLISHIDRDMIQLRKWSDGVHPFCPTNLLDPSDDEPSTTPARGWRTSRRRRRSNRPNCRWRTGASNIWILRQKMV